MSTGTAVRTSYNPFRFGTQLYRIFQILADGETHTLAEITRKTRRGFDELFSQSARRAEKKRVASAIRTIRQLPNYNVKFADGWYQLEHAES